MIYRKQKEIENIMANQSQWIETQKDIKKS